MVFNSTQPWLVDWSMHAIDATYRNNSLDWCSLFCVQACVHRVVLLCSAVSPFHRMLLWYCDMRETKSEHARRRRQQTLRYNPPMKETLEIHSLRPSCVFSPHHLPSYASSSIISDLLGFLALSVVTPLVMVQIEWTVWRINRSGEKQRSVRPYDMICNDKNDHVHVVGYKWVSDGTRSSLHSVRFYTGNVQWEYVHST